MEVAAEISGPFADRGRGFAFTTQPLKAPAAPPPAAKPDAGAARGFCRAGHAPAGGAAAGRPAISAARHHAGHASQRQRTKPSAAPLRRSRRITPRSVTPATNGGNGNNGSNGGNGNGHGLALPPGLRLAANNGNGTNSLPPTAKIPATPAAAAPRSELAQPAIFASLGELCGNWPDELKSEIASFATGRGKSAAGRRDRDAGLEARPRDDDLETTPLARATQFGGFAKRLFGAGVAVESDRPAVSRGAKEPSEAADEGGGLRRNSGFVFWFSAAAPPRPWRRWFRRCRKPPEQKIADTNYFVCERNRHGSATETATLRKSDRAADGFHEPAGAPEGSGRARRCAAGRGRRASWRCRTACAWRARCRRI